MRKATPADKAFIYDMMRDFNDAVKPRHGLKLKAAMNVLDGVIQHGFAAVTERGFILGIIQDHPLNQDFIIAKEFLWWAEDNNGLKLKKAFKDWAINLGAQEIQWSCPFDNERVKKVYSRNAEPTEIIYSEFV